jgi:hypothetical protein
LGLAWHTAIELQYFEALRDVPACAVGAGIGLELALAGFGYIGAVGVQRPASLRCVDRQRSAQHCGSMAPNDGLSPSATRGRF